MTLCLTPPGIHIVPGPTVDARENGMAGTIFLIDTEGGHLHGFLVEERELNVGENAGVGLFSRLFIYRWCCPFLLPGEQLERLDNLRRNACRQAGRVVDKSPVGGGSG